jgi:hypothetical protein
VLRLPLGREAALAAFALGLVLRIAWLPLWGTFDTEVQKAWAWRAATSGPADIYGPSDRELLDLARTRGEGNVLRGLRSQALPRTWFEWGSGRYFVDYPPGSVLVLWAAGKAYALFDPAMRNRPAFNAAINIAPLVGSFVIALLLLRSSRDPATGEVRALAFWLNPAAILAAPVLGYQDTVFGALALGSVLALLKSRFGLASVLVVAAGLVKPQGALLLPTFLAVLLREGTLPAWGRALGSGLASAAVILSPWWSSGHLLSALDGCLRPLTQTTLAPLGLNLWWLLGWLMDVRKAGGLVPARIVSLAEFRSEAGFDAAVVARILVVSLVLAVALWVWRRVKEDRQVIVLSIVLVVHGYAFFGTSVHENHTFLAVVLVPLLLGEWKHARPALVATSGFLFASLLCAAGFGRRVTRLPEVMSGRMVLGLDLSILVALGHAVLLAALFFWSRKAVSVAGDRRLER